MGTRHLIAVMDEGEYKVAQYGQWDGYLTGQGISILNFLKNQFDKTKFKESLKSVYYLTDEEYSELWLDIGVDLEKNNGMVNMDDSDRFKKVYPQLDRDVGSDVLSFVQASTRKIPLRNNIEFAQDSLFCEFAYVIDLDKNTFEVYEGFNENPLDKEERFYKEETPGSNSSGDTYYPVKLLACFDLDNLPSEEDFLAIKKEDE